MVFVHYVARSFCVKIKLSQEMPKKGMPKLPKLPKMPKVNVFHLFYENTNSR
jgi:hypothetical protein